MLFVDLKYILQARVSHCFEIIYRFEYPFEKVKNLEGINENK